MQSKMHTWKETRAEQKNGSTVLVIDTKTKEQNQKQEGLFWLLAPKRKRKLTTGVKKKNPKRKRERKTNTILVRHAKLEIQSLEKKQTN